MKTRQSAGPGRKQKPSVVHARRPANKLNVRDSFQLPNLGRTHARGWPAEGVLGLVKELRENQQKRQLLPDNNYVGSDERLSFLSFSGDSLRRVELCAAHAARLSCVAFPRCVRELPSVVQPDLC